ncbi:MAG: 3'-5' exonuclease, partial [Tepidiphilus sp.]|nr:3'-5' exonuclease [Tepidiphilus sp.]
MPEDVATAAPLAERYVLLDLETTGAHPERDRITEIALLRFEGGRLVERWQSLVRPDVPIPPLIERLVGITNAMVADAPPFESLAPELLPRLADAVLVAHNARFDYGFLRQAFRR